MPETKLGPFLRIEVPVETKFFTPFIAFLYTLHQKDFFPPFISEFTILVRVKYLPFGSIPFLTHLKHR